MPSESKATLPDNLAIRIEDLSISYKINVESKKTLKNAIMRASKGERVRTRTVEAVKHLNLDIPHGSVVGIVGANGAGKSTLMRSIAGILPPSTGKITVNGRISTLLALGVGFNKALSGRDNIILLDEALSAGDAAFKEKSFNRMRELCDEARTILIVSHALSSINELCDHAIWMHKGSMLASGKPEIITEQYLKFLNVGELPSSYEDL